MNILKAKTTINCETCGCEMRRTTSIKVTAETKAEAIAEAREKAAEWQRSLVGQSCRVCKSILAAVA